MAQSATSSSASSSSSPTGPPRLIQTPEGIYRSPYPTPKFPQKSVWDLIVEPISSDDGKLAIKECDKREQQITYAELKSRSIALAVGMQKKLGLMAGDTVMISSMNSIDWILVLFACQFLGLKTALANPMYLSHELAHVLRLTSPKYIFIQARNLKKFSVIGHPWSTLVLMDQNLNGYQGLGSLKTLYASPEECKGAKPHVPEDLDDVTYFCMSSGTTGLPKAVEITHRNVGAMLTMANHIPGGYDGKPFRNLAFLPFFHAFALLVCVMLTPFNHGTLYIQVPFDPKKYVETIAREQIEVSPVVPPVVAALSVAPGLKPEMFKSMRFMPCGGAALDADSQRRAKERLGLPIVQGWGMSEVTVGMLGLCLDAEIGSCGWLMPSGEARLVDEEMKDVKRGERGELLVRAPNVMKGYYRNEAATKETFHEPGHWLRTGDVAVVDEKGQFWIVDRIKELIKYKGFQVAPAELEGLLKKHPKVKLAAVIGINDKKTMTELPRAYVELVPGAVSEEKVAKENEEEELIKELDGFIRKQVSTHKYLRGGIKIIPQVPASATGKILRKEVRLMRKKEEEEMQGAGREAKL